MGSWYGTCGVSQLPIVDGDKVVLFLLQKNVDEDVSYNGMCHSDEIYEPVSVAVIGEYNDYGRIVVKDYDSRSILKLYGEDADLTDVGKLIDEKSEEKGLYFMLVHFDIYNKVIAEYGNMKNWFTKGKSYRSYMKESIQEFIELNRSENSLTAFMGNANRFKAETQWKLSIYTEKTKKDIFDEDYKNDKLVDKLADLMTFRHAMSESRKLWIPQAGQGSQERDYTMNKIIGTFVNELEERENDEW